MKLANAFTPILAATAVLAAALAAPTSAVEPQKPSSELTARPRWAEKVKEGLFVVRGPLEWSSGGYGILLGCFGVGAAVSAILRPQIVRFLHPPIEPGAKIGQGPRVLRLGEHSGGLDAVGRVRTAHGDRRDESA